MKNFRADKNDKKYYNKNGYIVFKSILSQKECEIYIKEAHKVCKNKITVTSNIYRKSKIFLNLLKHKKILSLADSLLDWRVIPIGDIFFFSKSKNKKESGSVPHQDNYAQRAEYGSFMACGVYLDEALEDNGALRVFPGSHKLGEIKSKPKPNWVYDKKGRIIKANPIGNNTIVPKAFKNTNNSSAISSHSILDSGLHNMSSKIFWKCSILRFISFVEILSFLNLQ